MKKLTLGIAAVCAVISLVLAGCDNLAGVGGLEDLTGENARYTAAGNVVFGDTKPFTVDADFTTKDPINFSNKNKGTITLIAGSESFTATWDKPFYSKTMNITFTLPSNVTLAASGHTYEVTSVGGITAVKNLRVVNGNRAIIANIDPKEYKYTLSLAGQIETPFTNNDNNISTANKEKGTFTLTAGSESFTASWTKKFYDSRMDIIFDLPAHLVLAPSGHTYTVWMAGSETPAIKPLRVLSNGKQAIITVADKREWKYSLSLSCNIVK